MLLRRRLLCATAVVYLATPGAYAQPAPAPAPGPAPGSEVPVEDEGDEVPVGDEVPPAEEKPKEGAPPAEKKEEPKGEQKPAEQKPADKKPAEKEPAAEEEALEEEGPSPSRPPPKGKGVIWGVVSDAKLAEPLVEAVVSIEGGKAKIESVADLDGRYRLELPPGTYSIRFWAELHRAEVAQDVRVEAGKVARLDAKLLSDEGAVDVVEVETQADKTAVEGQILTRQRAAAVGDSVGRAEIARTPDRNAAQAAQRVVGATVVGNRFVYVRGLGERYTNALLNGSPLPSPEPDRAAIPLDLFPTVVIDSLTIAKTFTPDVPGDFAGGSVRIDTREIPSKLVFQGTIAGGFNSQSTFRQRNTYRGGDTDWLGFDDGTRALPSGFPKTRIDPAGPAEENAAAGRSVNSYMSTQKGTSPVDHSANIVVGNGWDFGKDRKLGVLATLSYGRSYQLRKGEILNEFALAGPGQLIADRAYKVELGGDVVNWGAMGNVSYQLAAGHRINLLGLHSQIADNFTQETTGFHGGRSVEIRDMRLSFIERSLNFAQLRGEHRLKPLGDAQIDWAAWVSAAGRSEPDTRSIAFERPDAGAPWGYAEDTYSGRHFWSSQNERILGGKLDWTQPLVADDVKVKVGGFINARDRDFDSRAMHFSRLGATGNIPNCASGDFNACTDAILSPATIDSGALKLRETTQPEDAYKAKLNVYAGYVMADAKILPGVRVIAGERLEVTRQTIDPYDQFDPTNIQAGGRIHSSDLLPALATVVDIGKQAKVRGSLTRTLARPQLRELAPFAYTDFFGGRFVSGNPDLTMTHITNVDLRFEYFPTLKEVLALSLFYKSFEDPIETIATASGDRRTITFQNAQGADLYGVELEARKNLGFLNKNLDEFTGIANLTVATSSIDLAGNAREFLTNAARPMINQAPYVLNLAIDWTHEKTGTSFRALYNIAGARIVQVGSQGLPDAYMQPRHQVDLMAGQELNKHFQIRLTAANIFNADWVTTQGKEERDDNIVSRYSTGALYTLAATYTH